MSRRYVDRAGVRYGRLVAIEMVAERTPEGALRWRCRCDCGGEVTVTGGHLTSGSVKSCGCLSVDHCRAVSVSRRHDLAGRRYGRLLVSSRAPGRSRWNCRCDCGAEKIVAQSSMVDGTTTSCGCAHRDAVTIHGHTRRVRAGEPRRASRTFKTWETMLARCENERNDNYAHYGGRGIRVCERWHEFSSFLADMGERPAGMFLDRRENNGNYEPSNCRWVTAKVNGNNKRNNVRLTLDGLTLTATEWAERVGVSRAAIYQRVKRGLPVADVLRPYAPAGQ